MVQYRCMHSEDNFCIQKEYLIMNKIKDFFYNKNDIIIVLIILIAAGLIIYTRINAIMDYPEALAQKNAKAQQTTQAAESKETSASSESSTTASTETVTITISDSDDSVAVATKCYEAGLVSSDTEFQSYISEKGKESSLKSGTFQIPKGSTEEQILTIIAN